MKVRAWGRGFCLIFAVSAAATVWAQFGAAPRGPAPGLPPPANSSSPQGAQSSAPTIKTQTNLVPVRVVVRDREGHVVTNLKKEDFRLYQDGGQQEISNFTAISGTSNSLSIASAVPSGGAAAEGAGMAANGAPADAPARYIAIFFDDMHMQLNDMTYTKSAAENYLSSLAPADHVAIATATRIGELGFTTDRAKLGDAISKLAIHPSSAAVAARVGCPPMDYWEADAIVNDSGMTGQAVLDGAVQDTLTCSKEGDLTPRKTAIMVAQNTALATLFEVDAQTEILLQRVEQTLDGLSSLPGQRMVVLMSPGFLIAKHRQELAALIDRAIKSNVAVNTIETRRGFNTVALANIEFSTPAGPNFLNAFKGQDSLALMESQAGSDSQKLLSEIADSTGGRFFNHSDNYDAAFSHLARPPEFYYLLAYTPQNLPSDGRYHTIQVRLRPKFNYEVETRRGFYAPTAAETAEGAAEREVHDALFSDEEEHTLAIRFEMDVTHALSGVPQLGVRAVVDIAQLDLRKAKGISEDKLIVAAAIFDKDGNYVDGMQKADQISLDDTTLARVENTGLSLQLDFYVEPGEYTARIVAYDSNGGGVSAESDSVTVPN
jgi:VWFA-related protein